MEHGGNIYKASEELKIAKGDIIDFSASINPLGVPEVVISEITKNNINQISNYPDPDAKRLRFEIAKRHDIDPESIICGNGSIELIYLVVRALTPKISLIPAPTFSEYERACKKSLECRVMSYELTKEDGFRIDPDKFIAAMKGCNIAFLCNPNNPTGALLGREEVLAIAEAAKKEKCFLVVDEAFIDFLPGNSVIKEVEKNPYLIVLKSMTKFYAMAGLRLGYGVFPLNLIKVMQQHKEPWTVNTLAQNAGAVVFADTDYTEKTLELMKKEKQFMEDEFKKLHLSYISSTVNYYLLKLDNRAQVIASLRNKGIVVRDCSNFKGLDNSYIRVAVKSRRDNKLLLDGFVKSPTSALCCISQSFNVR